MNAGAPILASKDSERPGLGAALLGALEGGGAQELVDAIVVALRTAPPTAIERATSLYVWKKAWEIARPDSRRGGDRKSAEYRGKIKVQTLHFDFIEAVQELTGLSRRAAYLDVALAEELGAAAIRRLWTSPIADNAAALRAVAKLDGPGREHLFAIWSDNPKLGFGAAMLAARLRAAEDSEEAQFRRMLDAWSRASSKARRRFLAEISVDGAAAEDTIASWRKRGRT